MEKEVTYEEWKKNPTPRLMWVWDEIADETEKRMTNREFSWWLRGGHFREYKIQCTGSPVIRSTFDYYEGTENEEVCGDIYVRENGCRWVEPLKSLLSD